MYFGYKKNIIGYIISTIVLGILIYLLIIFKVDTYVALGWISLLALTSALFNYNISLIEIKKLNRTIYIDLDVINYNLLINKYLSYKLKGNLFYRLNLQISYLLGLICLGDFVKANEVIDQLETKDQNDINESVVLKFNYYNCLCLTSSYTVKKEYFISFFTKLNNLLNEMDNKTRVGLLDNTYNLYRVNKIIYEIITANNVTSLFVTDKIKEESNFVKTLVLFYLINNDLVIDHELNVMFEDYRRELFTYKYPKGHFYKRKPLR